MTYTVTTARAAARMRSVVAPGCEAIEACDAGTSTIVDPARSAMHRCVSGGIALSSVPSRYQEGTDLQAIGPDGAPNAASVNGRWATGDEAPLVHLRELDQALTSSGTHPLM